MAGTSENGSDPSIPKIRTTSGIDAQLPDYCFHGDDSTKCKT